MMTPKKGQSHGPILIVDDEKTVLDVAKAILEKAGHAVQTALDVKTASKMLQDSYFDCIITDAMMPGTDGYDFVQTVRAHPTHKTTPVLMLTRKRNREDVKKAVEAGVTDYIIKPIDEQLLLDKVELSINTSSQNRHVFELSLYAEPFMADVQINCPVVKISESTLTFRLPFPVTATQTVHYDVPLFEEIGMDQPLLAFTKCEMAKNSADEPDQYYAQYTFMGIQEADLKKIRAWLQKESIRRRK